eukprot:7467342-Pyramimonas_sp.AAC.1
MIPHTTLAVSLEASRALSEGSAPSHLVTPRVRQYDIVEHLGRACAEAGVASGGHRARGAQL